MVNFTSLLLGLGFFVICSGNALAQVSNSIELLEVWPKERPQERDNAQRSGVESFLPAAIMGALIGGDKQDIDKILEEQLKRARDAAEIFLQGQNPEGERN